MKVIHVYTKIQLRILPQTKYKTVNTPKDVSQLSIDIKGDDQILHPLSQSGDPV